MNIQAVLMTFYYLVIRIDYGDSVNPSCSTLREYVHSGECCNKCTPGKFVKNHCNKTTQTVCEPCMDGTFSSDWNFKEECSLCNNYGCKPTMGLVQICNSTVDNRCGCVESDQFHDTATDSCRDCVRCPLGRYPEKPCTGETICSPCQKGYFSNKTDNYYEPCERCKECVLYQTKCTSTNDAVCSRDFFPTTHVTIPQRQAFEEKSTPNLKSKEKHGQDDSNSKETIKFEPILIVVIILIVLVILTVCIFLIVLHWKRKKETYPCRASYGFNIIKESRGRTFSFGGLLLREQPARIILGLHALLNPKTPNNWRAVAAELDISYLDILNYEANIETACKEMLYSWGTSNDATVDKLYEVLRKIGRDDACTFLEEKVELERGETTV